MIFNNIYNLYYDLIKDQYLFENKQSFLLKNSSQLDVKQLVDKYWNQIRGRVSAPQNDIDWWINKPFEEFRSFVNTFNLKNKSDKRQDQIIHNAKQAGAVILGELKDYEVWYIPNYEASILIGRNYKNRPSHWCISSDDPEYWYDTYEDSEFIFLVRKQLKNDEYDKVAIQFENFGKSFYIDNIIVWDLNDNDDYDSLIIPDMLIRECWYLLKQSGLSKDRSY